MHGLKYSSFVDYSKLDPAKSSALKTFAKTFSALAKHGVRLVPESVGHTASVLDFKHADFMLAFNLEGLGTKSLIADRLAVSSKSHFSKKQLQTFYQNLAWDCVASTVNDLCAVGAQPLVLADMISASHSDVLADPVRMQGLLTGFQKAALKYGFAIPCGETPVYPGMFAQQAIDLSAASLGIISSKQNAILGQNLKAGDRIYGLASSGLHTNGLTLARKIAEQLPQKYLTKLSSGKTLAEELLKPSNIYSNLVQKLLHAKVKLHYMNPITGHGWQKIMRPKQNFIYRIENVPSKPKLFEFLQEHGKVSDFEAHQTWNMGLGFVIMAPKSEGKKIEKMAKQEKIKFFDLGIVERGEKKVAIEPLNIVYKKLF